MAVTLKKLYHENANPFKLSLCAGHSGIRNVVSWVYMLEDESIIPYFHGAELAVTTGMKYASTPSWLMGLIKRLIEHRCSGLIINTGKFIFEIPEEIIDYCNEHDFPLMTMPWEITITKMIQDFCVKIIDEQHESTAHDKAMRDAILRRENEEEYRDTLARYYHLDGTFTVISIYLKTLTEDIEAKSNTQYWLETRLRRLKTDLDMKQSRMGIITDDNNTLLILNNITPSTLPKIQDIILDVYAEAVHSHHIFIGVGISVSGLSNIYKSYNRAITAMRMAMYRNEAIIQFEQMGFYKILFSIKDEDLLYAYANEILAPLDQYDARNHHYVELLKAYIENDRSLAKTAEALYLHRNTVNYQIQKMKTMLDSPLKTVEDLFPYQVALAIRDMQTHPFRLK